jgi:hypothetical protein
LLRCSEYFGAPQMIAARRALRPTSVIATSTLAISPEKRLRVSARDGQYPGAALTLPGNLQQTLAK